MKNLKKLFSILALFLLMAAVVPVTAKADCYTFPAELEAWQQGMYQGPCDAGNGTVGFVTPWGCLTPSQIDGTIAMWTAACSVNSQADRLWDGALDALAGFLGILKMDAYWWCLSNQTACSAILYVLGY